jgi:hypothetical protein
MAAAPIEKDKAFIAQEQQFPVSKAGGADGRPASRYARDLVTLLR